MPRLSDAEAAAALDALGAAGQIKLYQSIGFQQGDEAAGRDGIVARLLKPKAALLRLKDGAWRIVANVRQIARSDPARYAVYLTDASTQRSGFGSLAVDEVVDPEQVSTIIYGFVGGQFAAQAGGYSASVVRIAGGGADGKVGTCPITKVVFKVQGAGEAGRGAAEQTLSLGQFVASFPPEAVESLLQTEATISLCCTASAWPSTPSSCHSW